MPSPNRPHSESRGFELKRISRIKAWSVGRPSSNVKEGEDCTINRLPFSHYSLMVQKKSISIVLDKMKPVCMDYDAYIPDLLEEHEDIAGNSLEEKVDLLTYPPFVLRNENSNDSYSHDIFTFANMSNFVDFAHQVMAVRAQGHVLCSWMQLQKWYKKLGVRWKKY